MEWKLTLLAVHLAALFFLWTALRGAPCILQVIAICCMGAGFLALTASDVAAVFDLDFGLVRINGYEAVSVGVMIYTFRLWFVENVCRISWHWRKQPDKSRS